MPARSPAEVLDTLTKAINSKDLDTALSLYESQAVFVVTPTEIVTGTPAVRKALEDFITLNPTLTISDTKVIEAGDIALFHSKWFLVGTSAEGSPVTMEGKSSNILRRRADGAWKIAVDNPWGTAILKEGTSLSFPYPSK